MLPTLISHIRSAHSHEPELNFSCGIDSCPKPFKNTNTYYKHVRSVHKARYSETSDTLEVKQLSKISTTESESDEHVTVSNFNSDLDIHTFDDTTDEEMEPANEAQEKSDAISRCVRLKCKAGVTQTLLPSIVEMNEAVLDGVLTNLSKNVAERLQANGIEAESSLAREIMDVIESHRNPLQSLQTVCCQNSKIQSYYPMIVSFKINGKY